MRDIQHYFLGLDLGKDRDFSAIAVMVHSAEGALDLVTLIRLPLGTEYLDVFQRLLHLVTRIFGCSPSCRLHVILDAAGPGQVAAEFLRRRRPDLEITPALLSAAAAPRALKNGKVTIPRHAVLANLRGLLESGVLRIAGGLALGPALEAELAAIRSRGRQAAHDDLAVAAALAAWQAVSVVPRLRQCRPAA